MQRRYFDYLQANCDLPLMNKKMIMVKRQPNYGRLAAVEAQASHAGAAALFVAAGNADLSCTNHSAYHSTTNKPSQTSPTQYSYE